MVASRYTPPVLRPLKAAKVVYEAPKGVLVNMGHQATFLVKALGAIPMAFKHYSKEVWRLLSDVTWGNGAILVGGGTIGVIILMGVMIGATVGIEAYSALNILGLGPFTGGLSAFGTTREFGPLLAAVAFASQSGCRFTAQLGAMRINEEIDALEALGIRPMPYLVTTRMIAAVIAIVPLYSVALAANYLSTEFVYMFSSHQGSGTYMHYFYTFILGRDVIFSFIKVIVYTLLATFIQCYYGFFASGGPEGVGVAAGHAIRAAIVVIVFANFILTFAFWGTTAGIRITG
ncbi:ABC transporter permease [Jongsikchunia kroppenstedtii]|uniref:ABC transporter permease n=1 Tax=Jongsikchunia kroppenstedtii TaxID=1121721 RepID=UPI00035C2707|nr:ABC transporter permease [Jongsikchunia kroppenstedtii]